MAHGYHVGALAETNLPDASAGIPGVASVDVTLTEGDEEDLVVAFDDPGTGELLLWHNLPAREYGCSSSNSRQTPPIARPWA